MTQQLEYSSKPFFRIKRLNAVYMRIWASDPFLFKELSDYFTFDSPNAKFDKRVRRGVWDGKVRMFNMRTQCLYIGLVSTFLQWADKNGYGVVTINDSATDPFFPEIPNEDDTSEELILDWISTLDITAEGKHIELHDHQESSIVACIQRGRMTLLSPTASGKSLVLYCLSRWYAENVIDPNRKILIIVPTIGLVTQLFKDFKDYSSVNGWNVDSNVHFIYAGREKENIDQQIVITTWQSIYDLPRSWFDCFDVVIGDECHHFKDANSLPSILKKMPYCTYRFGTTGTLDGSKLHPAVVEGLFGEIFQPITTREMIDKDLASKLQIEVILLSYPNSECVPRSYPEEIEYIISNQQRLEFVANHAISLSGNTLVLFQFVDKHGKPLHKLIQSKLSGTNRKVFYVSGETPAEEREKVRSLTERESDAIIVASYKTFSTGINIRKLHNIISASPFKARIQLLQSIGRQLRKHDTKDVAVFYDIADKLWCGKKMNYTYYHLMERMKIYTSEQFDHNVTEMNISN